MNDPTPPLAPNAPAVAVDVVKAPADEPMSAREANATAHALLHVELEKKRDAAHAEVDASNERDTIKLSRHRAVDGAHDLAAELAHDAIDNPPAPDVVDPAAELEALRAEHATLKQAHADLARAHSMAQASQPAAPGGWDQAKNPPPSLRNDRIRQQLFDQLKERLESGAELERGLKSTCKEILARVKRLAPEKRTPRETILLPLILDAEARQWRPDPARAGKHRVRAMQPSKRL